MKQTVGIIGVGFMGGSIGSGLLKQGISVVGYDKDRAIRNKAAHCVTTFEESIERLTAQADIILIAAPISALSSIFSQLQKCSQLDKKIVSDISSVKQEVVEIAADIFGDIPPWFVPAHPLAGTEKSTAEFAQPDLFDGKKVILTPLHATASAALECIVGLWELLGSESEIMDVTEHDQILAMTSHLPHVVAYSLVHLMADKDHRHKLLRYSASGMKDFTRVAMSNPKMWRDICMANRENTLNAVTAFQEQLKTFKDALESCDSHAVTQFFLQAQDYQKEWKQ